MTRLTSACASFTVHPRPFRAAPSGSVLAPIVALLMLMIALASSPVLAQTAHQPPTFVARTDAVRLDVLVTRGDAPVVGLTAADFEVRDNDVPQRVLMLAQGDAPVDIVLVLDVSGSMEGERIERLIDGVRALLTELRPGDRLGVLTFSQRTRLPIPLTADTGTIRSLLRQIVADGLTSLNDAAYLGLMSGDPGVRTLVIAFSDGEDRSSWLTTGDVVEAGRRADAVVYGVVLKSPLAGEPTPDLSVVRPKPVLDALSRQSGGRTVVTPAASGLSGIFRGLLAEFRQRYVLAFEPGPGSKPGWHALRVRVTTSRADVSARAGYFVAPR